MTILLRYDYHNSGYVRPVEDPTLGLFGNTRISILDRNLPYYIGFESSSSC